MKQEIKKWKTYSFDELFDFDGGMGIPRDQLGNVGIPYLHYGDMHTSSKDFIDIDSYIGKNLPRYDTQTSGKSQLNDGDLVFVDASEDYEGTCKTFLIKNIKNQPFISGLHTFIAREKNKVISNDFKKYITRIPQVKSQIFKLVQGYKVYGINRDNLKLITVDLPEFDESQKIADVLTTWDNAVELQEKKIEKLQEKKKALMQKLLTPKPDWEGSKLGEICEISTGKLDANKMVEDGSYPFFTCSKDIYRIDKFAYDCEALLMAGNGEIGDIKYYNGKFNAYQRTYVLTNFKLDIKYVMQYLLLNFDRTVCKGMQKSSMPYIKLGLLQDAIILYPKNIEKISKALDLFDDKIQIERQLLEKYKEQRKALMQLLLTGIVRV